MGGEKWQVAVLEDETSLGEDWLDELSTHKGWAVPHTPVLFEIKDVLAWIDECKNKNTPWLLVSDVDIVDSTIPDSLLETQQNLRKEHGQIADFTGAVLLEYLRQRGLTGHVLVVTGVNFGSLHDWLGKIGVARIAKPVWATEVTEALQKLSRKLGGGS